MITRSTCVAAQRRAAEQLTRAGIHLAPGEWERISVADFGLGRLEVEGGQILTMVNTERISAKVIALFPSQTLPEHWHPPVGTDPGKEETLRVVAGTLLLYTPGTDPGAPPSGHPPAGKEAYYTARAERRMFPGDTVTLPPGVPHWFQAERDGAVLYSFSTCARDVLDGFTDPAVVRETVIVDDPAGEA